MLLDGGTKESLWASSLSRAGRTPEQGWPGWGTWGGRALAEGPWALGVGCLQNGTSPSVSPLA